MHTDLGQWVRHITVKADTRVGPVLKMVSANQENLLLKEMDSLHLILDVTHLTDLGFKEAMEIFKGPIWASHHNCRPW